MIKHFQCVLPAIKVYLYIYIMKYIIEKQNIKNIFI